MISQATCHGSLFRKAPERLILAKYPAIARLGPNGIIIPTVHNMGERNGPFYITQPSYTGVVTTGTDQANNLLYHIFAMHEDAVYAYAVTSFAVQYATLDGGVYEYDFETKHNAVINTEMKNSLLNLQCIGFARTRLPYLAPDIQPFRLYADKTLSMAYPDNCYTRLSEKPDVFEDPPMDMYRELLNHDEADWIISVNGTYKLYKGGEA